jgi:hypothetical protein
MTASLGGFLLPLVVLAFGGFLGVVWTVQLLRVLLSREARGRLTRRASLHWGVCPATGLLFGALSLTPWPYALSVKLGEPALLRIVEDLEQGRANARDPGRAGLIFVDDAQVREDCVLLYTGWGYLTLHGLAYSRDGAPPEPPFARVRHLYGRWYTFCEDPF